MPFIWRYSFIISKIFSIFVSKKLSLKWANSLVPQLIKLFCFAYLSLFTLFTCCRVLFDDLTKKIYCYVAYNTIDVVHLISDWLSYNSSPTDGLYLYGAILGWGSSTPSCVSLSHSLIRMYYVSLWFSSVCVRIDPLGHYFNGSHALQQQPTPLLWLSVVACASVTMVTILSCLQMNV